MRNGGTERPGPCPLDVDVDPLVVAGGVGEKVDLLLADLVPVTWRELASHHPGKVAERWNDLHGDEY